MKIKLAVALAWGIALLAQSAALAAPPPGPLAGKRVLVHLKTSFKQDDNQPCVAFDVAFAALKERAKVEVFFDAAAVVDLKVWQGKPTSLGYELPEKLKNILASEYKAPNEKDFPENLSGISPLAPRARGRSNLQRHHDTTDKLVQWHPRRWPARGDRQAAVAYGDA